LQIDDRRLARDLGVPVVPTIARKGHGLDQLLQSIHDVATGETICHPHRVKSESPAISQAIAHLETVIQEIFPDLPNTRWVAMRLLDGDQRIVEAMRNGELAELSGVDLDQDGSSTGLKLEPAT
jgi:ferrous iron transport protein B